MTTKQTPGPWAVADVGEVVVCATGRTLCDVYSSPTTGDEQADADAHLIAAAPDLQIERSPLAPGEGTWSVFAEEVVEERDAAREEAARLRKTIEGVSRSLAAAANGWPYEHEPVLHVSQALKLACDTIDDLRRNNEYMRTTLEDIREWAKHDDVIRFDDGDISLADYCAQALHRSKP